MDGDSLVSDIMDSEYPSGPVLVHVVTADEEYWLEVTAVKTTTLVDTGWVNGILIETRPISEGVRARKSIIASPAPQTPFYITPPESRTVVEVPEVTVPQLPSMVGIDPGDPTGIAVSGVKITDWEIDIDYRVIDRYRADQQFWIRDHKPVESEEPVDPNYGRPPTIEDIATKSPEQLAQMYPNGLPIFTPHDPADSLTSETENLQPPQPEVRFEQYRSPFQEPARPVPGKSYARMELAQHGQLPETGWRYETAPEFAGAGTEHLAEELELKRQAAEELIEKNPFPADEQEQQDQAEPHYAVAREINERQISEAFGTDQLFANSHMGDPKE